MIEDNDFTKKLKETINELEFQLNNNFKDIKNFKIKKNTKDEIKEILIKFKYQ